MRRFERLAPQTATLPGARFYLRGCRIHLIIEGSGPPLLLLHGLLASGAAFRRVAPLLRDRYSLVVPDLPGFGYSDRSPAADHSYETQAVLLHELLDRLEVERAAVLGHSTGAALAVRMAAARPERVVALILAGGPGEYDATFPRLTRPLLALALPLAVESRWAVRWLNRLAMASPRRLDERTVERHLDAARVPGHAATLLTILTATRHGPPPPPEALTLPVLLLAGSADRYLPPVRARSLARTLPDGRAVVVPAAGHLLLEDQPEASAAAIRAFLDPIAPARDPRTNRSAAAGAAEQVSRAP